jgi:hypothetical protein
MPKLRTELQEVNPKLDTPTPSSLVHDSPSVATEETVDNFAMLIRESLGHTSQNVFKVAALVSKAFEALGHVGFRKLSKKVGQSDSTLNKFVTIHSHRDRFTGREHLMPHSWTVAYAVQSLPDAHFETLAAEGIMRPELSEKEVKKFVAQREAAAPSTRKASDELNYISVTIVFPALLSLKDEDEMKKEIFELLDNKPDVTVRISDRRKYRTKRRLTTVVNEGE